MGSKMVVQDRFLEPEVRDGFYVPSEVKQAWAAELEVLAEIDRICKKYDIAYFADWGTLLGAVRHGGFIPWDDDLDITMKRADYERFLQVAKKEMRDDYALFTYASHPDFWSFLARFVAKDKICFEEEHLKKFHGFPYVVGIDIFVLDYVSADKEKEEERCSLARLVIEAADALANGKLKGIEAERILDRIEERLHIRLHDRQDLRALRVQLYREAEKLFAMFSESEAEELTRMMPNGLYHHGNLKLYKEYYQKQIWLPFEDTQIPVPSGYDEMLRKRYGDYMKLVRNSGGHNYPFFESQRKQLQAVLDFDMPGYKYTEAAPRDEVRGRRNSLKGILAEGYEQLQECVKQIADLYLEERKEQVAPDMELLGNCQQIAIDMGTVIERCKGEGHPVVGVLERFCEAVYELSLSKTAVQVQQLLSLTEELAASVKKHILERTEAVFLPSKAAEWKYMQSVWQAAMEDETCDVYVIPIPYFYKEYDGALRDMQYEAGLFPEHLHVVSYDAFDFALHYPETIFIQNPYDEADKALSVHSFFYSTNLRKYTEQLVYIPPFVLAEFTKDSYREYFNLKYYCTVPGVVNADKVIVQSENMKQLYAEKLTEFAGADTKAVWEEKIVGWGSPVEDIRINAVQTVVEQIPEEWKRLREKQDGSHKKVLLYYTGISGFMQYKDKMIDKVRETFAVFAKHRDEILVLWKVQPLLKATLKQAELELYERYCELEQQYDSAALGVQAETEPDDALIAFSDVYYGEASPLARMCGEEKKPVMIQRVSTE